MFHRVRKTTSAGEILHHHKLSTRHRIAMLNPADIIIVSGLPRSGTSLMMQMLAAGGVPAATDQIRSPDDDNPRGYFELEAVKKLQTDAAWIASVRGQAVKVVSQLLPSLPTSESYRVLFMRRDLDEVLASQEAMIARRGGKSAPREKLRAAFAAHLEKNEAWLGKQSHMPTLWLDYAAVVADPAAAAARVNDFLGGGFDEAAIVAAVDPALYRNRTGGRT